METRIGAIGIKTKIGSYDFEKVLKDLIKKDFNVLNEDDIHNGQQVSFDHISPDLISICRTKNAVWIINRGISDWFFNADRKEDHELFFRFFNRPNLMFAFNTDDGSCGYSIFKKGIKIRTRHVVLCQKAIDNGILQEEELEVLNSETGVVDFAAPRVQQDDLNDKAHRNCPEKLLTSKLLESLMMEYFGHSTSALYSETIQRSHYRAFLDSKRQTMVKKDWMKWIFFKRRL